MSTHPWFGDRVVPELPVRVRTAASYIRQAMHDVPWTPTPTPLRPFVLSRGPYRELVATSTALLALVRRAALASAPTRAGRIAALGADDHGYPPELFLSDDRAEERYCAVMARPDVVIGPEGPKFCEFNISGAVGNAVQTRLLTAAWQTLYARDGVAPFAGPDLFEVRARMFRSVCGHLGAPPAVVLVGSIRGIAEMASTRYYDVEVEYLRRHGLAAEYAAPEDLLETLGEPGRPRYRTGLRHLTTFEWRQRGVDWAPVAAALRRGCLLLSPQTCHFLDNKKVLAWLSEGQPWMTGTDHALVRRYLPWTRIVTERKVEWRDRVFDLADLLVSTRESFVLKGSFSMKGLDVMIGRDTDRRTWVSAVEAALRTEDVIVQEYVEPARYDLPLTDGSDAGTYRAEVAPVLSPFIFAGEPAGCFVRYRPDGGTGNISMGSLGAHMNVAVVGA
jgi:hypothetical protein